MSRLNLRCVADTQVQTSITDPLPSLIDNGNEALIIQIAIAGAMFGVVLIFCIVYFFSRKRPRVKEALARLDCYTKSHQFAFSESLVRKRRAIGGLFTVVAICAMVTLSAVLIVQAQLVKNYVEAISPNRAPFNPFGLFNVSVRLVGAPGCVNPVISGPNTAQIQGSSSSGSYADGQGSITMWWACSACAATATSLPISFTINNIDCYAAIIDFSASFPGYTATPTAVDGTPFVVAGSIIPAQPIDSVFRDVSSTQIGLSLVPVWVHQGSGFVGTIAQVASSVPGPVANAVSLHLCCWFLIAFTDNVL